MIEPKIAPDEILARLNHTGAIETRRVIVETIDRLPVKVQSLALSLTFVSVGASTLGLAQRFGNADVVFLSDDVTRSRRHDAQSICAHEIAHHWRGHTRRAGRDLAQRFQEEAEACLLVSTWGFDGFGANVAAQQRLIAGQVREVFGRFPALAVAVDSVDHVATWELEWIHHGERLWDELIATFTDSQRAVFEGYKHANEMAKLCAAARVGAADASNIEQPPTTKGNRYESIDSRAPTSLD